MQIEGESSWFVSFFVRNHLELTFYQPILKKYHAKPKHALIEAETLLSVAKPDVGNLAKGVKDD